MRAPPRARHCVQRALHAARVELIRRDVGVGDIKRWELTVDAGAARKLVLNEGQMQCCADFESGQLSDARRQPMPDMS